MNAKHKQRLVVGSLALLTILALYVLRAQPKARAFSVSLTGAQGTELRGFWVADGVTNEFQGTLPTNFTHCARSVSFELVQKGGPGHFRLALTPAGSQLGPLSGETDYGLRGHIAFNGRREDRLLNSFSRQ